MRMQEFTRNKGLDANGIYCDENISLSHDRLSILDLSDDANQPMVFENLIISFNKS